MEIKGVLILSAIVILSTGCAGVSSNFQCNDTTTDRCMTMEQANDRARALTEKMQTPAQTGPQPAQKKAALPVLVPDLVITSAPLLPRQTAESALALTAVACQHRPCAQDKQVTPVRLPDLTARLWIAPYVDSQDVLHQPGRLFFVATPARWRLTRLTN
jgi:conjugal transfer pilus assembly protein TraV